MPVPRRALLRAACCLPILALPGCLAIGDIAGAGFEDAIRRLLTVSSQRAFSNLLRENGFFQDELARIDLPPQLGGAGAASAASFLLRNPQVQQQLVRIVNAAAAEAAGNAAPIVYDSIRSMTIPDALAIVRGGPTAATNFLQRSIGERIVEVLFPGVGNALRLLDSGILGQALAATTGIDLTGVQSYVTREASEGIWSAIGREEAAIRADPSSADDPVLSSVFGRFR